MRLFYQPILSISKRLYTLINPLSSTRSLLRYTAAGLPVLVFLIQTHTKSRISLMTTMDTYSIESNTSILSYSIDDDKVVDYGYEDHGPDIRHDVEDSNPTMKPTAPITNTFYIADNFTSISSHGKDLSCTNGVGSTDATEVSQSPSQRLKGMWSRVGMSKLADGTAQGTTSMHGQGFNPDCGDEEDDDDGDDDDDSSCENIRDEHVIDCDAVLVSAARSVGTTGTWHQVQRQASTPQQDDDNSMTNDETSLYPPMPPDRQARKQRSFRRRGGELHGALLKSAVMASMSFDYDDSNDEDDGTEKFPMGRFRNARRESCQSSISLQSLQDALRSETSPRKRARRGQRRKSFDDDNDEEDEGVNLVKNDVNNNRTAAVSTNKDMKQNDDTMEASDLFVNMRVGAGRTNGNGSIHKNRTSGNSGSRRANSGATSSSHFHSSISSSVSDFSVNAAVAAAEIVREAPPRRVSRKTSYDSRASDYDSDFDSDEWDL